MLVLGAVDKVVGIKVEVEGSAAFVLLKLSVDCFVCFLAFAVSLLVVDAVLGGILVVKFRGFGLTVNVKGAAGVLLGVVLGVELLTGWSIDRCCLSGL